MAEEKDWIDIQREVAFTQSDLDFIDKNPSGLTKEGCQKELQNWKLSTNKYRIKVFEVMIKRCKNFTASGKTTKGQIVYARDKDGKPKWVQPEKEVVSA